MKRMKHILNGFIALAMVLMFTQCTDNKANERNDDSERREHPYYTERKSKRSG